MKPIITITQLYFNARENNIENPILKEVIRNLQASPGITVKQMAASMGIDRNSLSASVRMLTGESLGTFLKQWRLMLLIDLLRDPLLPYEAVAKRGGFTTVQTMSKFLDRMLHRTAYELREGRSNGHRKQYRTT